MERSINGWAGALRAEMVRPRPLYYSGPTVADSDDSEEEDREIWLRDQVRARHHLLTLVADGNVEEARPLLPPPGPALDSLWQYVFNGSSDPSVARHYDTAMYELLYEAGLNRDLPTAELRNMGNGGGPDYDSESERYAYQGWKELVSYIGTQGNRGPHFRIGRGVIKNNIRGKIADLSLPPRAIDILLNYAATFENFVPIVEEASGQTLGNERSNPFFSDRWLIDDSSEDDEDPVPQAFREAFESDSDDDNFAGFRTPAVNVDRGTPPRMVYTDRVDLPPSYKSVVLYEASHPSPEVIDAVERNDIDTVRELMPDGEALDRLFHHARTVEMMKLLAEGGGANAMAIFDGVSALGSYIKYQVELEQRVDSKMMQHSGFTMLNRDIKTFETVAGRDHDLYLHVRPVESRERPGTTDAAWEERGGLALVAGKLALHYAKSYVRLVENNDDQFIVPYGYESTGPQADVLRKLQTLVQVLNSEVWTYGDPIDKVVECLMDYFAITPTTDDAHHFDVSEDDSLPLDGKIAREMRLFAKPVGFDGMADYRAEEDAAEPAWWA